MTEQYQLTQAELPIIKKTYGERICMECGKSFTATSPIAKLCSNECRKIRNNISSLRSYHKRVNGLLQPVSQNTIKICPICHTNFTKNKSSRAIYCSLECRKTNEKLNSKPNYINTIKYDNEFKNRSRDFVINQMTGPVRNGLMFPGRLCLDVKELIAKGFIDEYSKIIAIEEHAKNSDEIEKFLTTMQIDHSIFHGRYNTMKYLLSHMGMVKSNLCWFDACQMMVQTNYDWLYNNINLCGQVYFEPGTLFAFSFVSQGRGQTYIKVSATQSFNFINGGIENVSNSFSQQMFDEMMYTVSTLIPFPIKNCVRYAYSSPRIDGKKSQFTIYTYTFIT